MAEKISYAVVFQRVDNQVTIICGQKSVSTQVYDGAQLIDDKPPLEITSLLQGSEAMLEFRCHNGIRAAGETNPAIFAWYIVELVYQNSIETKRTILSKPINLLDFDAPSDNLIWRVFFKATNIISNRWEIKYVKTEKQ